MVDPSRENAISAMEATEILPTSLPLFVRATAVPSDPDAPSFLLLHGYGGSSFTWRHWVGPLRQRGRVVLVDMKGFGRAPKPDDDDYGPSQQAALVVRLIAELGLERVTLIGHSLGGGVSLMGQPFLDLLSEQLSDRVFRPFQGRQQIVPAALGENVVLAGALML